MPAPVRLTHLGFPDFEYDSGLNVELRPGDPSGVRDCSTGERVPLRLTEGRSATSDHWYFVVYLRRCRVVYARAVLATRMPSSTERLVVHHYDYLTVPYNGGVVVVGDDHGRLAWVTRAEHARLHRLGL